MYIRTKKGEIFDCYESEQMHKPIYYLKKSKANGYIHYEDVYKKSDNIINILEVGDYVNGLRVEENKYGELYVSYVYYGGDIGKQYEVYTTWLKDYKENEDWIETIVTREQFEAMQYKVGE